MLRNFSFLLLAIMLLALPSCATQPSPRANNTSPYTNIKAGRSVTVQQGETLYAFARRNKSSMREIIDLNRLQAPYQLSAGSVLKLPASDADLPSVELGPIAAANEKDYKSRHSAKPKTTYTQIAPEPIGNPVAQDADAMADPYAPQLNGEPSALQDAANQQFDRSAPRQPRQVIAQPQTPTAALNLQPMVFDKQNKSLIAPTKPTPVLKTPVLEETPKKVSASAYKPHDKNGKLKIDPNTDGAEPLPPVKPVVATPQLKAPAVEAKVEPPADGKMHSRIEKGPDPKNFIWPVNGTVISTYGPKSNGLNNDGINIGVPRGTPVVAADGGTVAYAGSDIPGYGNVVLVRHPTGLMTTYAHLDRMFVQQDIVVAKGDMLGSVGTSGGVDTPQLHFEIRRNKEALDPSKYLYK